MKRKIFGLILIVAVCASLGVGSVVASGAYAFDTTISDWGLEYFNQLDYGIYWYADPNNDVPTKNYQFDANKPTLIFTHGWKPNESHLREGLSLKGQSEDALKDQKFAEYPYEKYFYKYYIEQGYNVGVFYWNQLIDEMLDFGVDEKIWTSTGGHTMRYKIYSSEKDETGRLSDDNDPNNPKKSVAMLYAEAILAAVGKNYSQELHLAGHSMGGQLTCAASEALCYMYDKGEISHEVLPDRLTLLDPYISSTDVSGTEDHTGKNINGKLVAELVADAMETVRLHGIPIEAYGANLGFVFRNYNNVLENNAKSIKLTERIGKNCVWVYMEPINLFGGFSPTHVMAVDYYFNTNNFEVRKSVEGITVPSAKVPTEELQSLIGLTFKQSTDKEKKENPFYYSEGKFEIVNFDTMEAPDTVKGSTKSASKSAKIVATLYDLNDKKIQEQTVETTGDNALTYSFKKVPVGKYKVVVSYNGVANSAVDAEVKPFGKIIGQLDRSAVNVQENEAVKAEVVDAEGNVVAEATVDQAGYYYASNLATGKYTIRFVSGDKILKTIKGVEADGSTVIPQPVKEDKTEKIILYVIIAACAGLVIVTIVGVIVAARKRKNRKHAL